MQRETGASPFRLPAGMVIWLITLAPLLSPRIEPSLSFSCMASEQGFSPPLTCCRTENSPWWPLSPFQEGLNAHFIPIPEITFLFIRPYRKKKKRYSRRVPSKQMKLKVPCDFWIAWQPFKLSLLQIESSYFPLVVACMHDFTWSICWSRNKPLRSALIYGCREYLLSISS